jgi:hypothetical protein
MTGGRARRPWEVFRDYERLIYSLDQSAGDERLFAGYTRAEVEDALTDLRRETEIQSAFFLLASIEAELFAAVDRATPSLRRRVRASLVNHPRQATFRDVVEAWTDAGGFEAMGRARIGDFKQLLDHRDWLAHGRRWARPSSLASVHPFLVWERARELFSAIGPPLPRIDDELARMQTGLPVDPRDAGDLDLL